MSLYTVAYLPESNRLTSQIHLNSPRHDELAFNLLKSLPKILHCFLHSCKHTKVICSLKAGDPITSLPAFSHIACLLHSAKFFINSFLRLWTNSPNSTLFSLTFNTVCGGSMVKLLTLTPKHRIHNLNLGRIDCKIISPLNNF